MKFYKLPQELTANKELKASDKIIFAVILDHMGGKSYCWPGTQRLMSKTGLSRQTVINSIKQLEKAELLIVNRQGNGKVNRYKTSLETRPVEDLNQSKNHTTTSLETRPEPVYKLDRNQTKPDLTNQTTTEFSFPLRGEGQWGLTAGKLKELEEAFPDKNVTTEIAKAKQWLIDNPTRRKTHKGMSRFLNNWLERAKPESIIGKPFTKEIEDKLFNKWEKDNAKTPEELDEMFKRAGL